MYTHIILPVDDTPRSMQAARAAIEIARKFKARLTAVHVVAPYSPHAVGEIRSRGSDPLGAQEYGARAEQRAQRLLDKVAAEAKAARVACETRVAVDDDAARAIIATTAAARGDLVVMASSNRKGLERIMLGSVASEVLAKGKTPVLVCR